ncbi:efflux RND transporter periplasmic adaptor subunit [Veillonella caviae]|uniref:efflux RND transporter periplasmic adaptor subunit n=1 Tax=Veillonella caviae TaxID=248316 RepID=UPI0023F0C3F5|nr:efflux RND transporter periplasmic adaptor subunit [Veillonella caviae]MCI6406449.1 efflux RND transporter periplasmic adaptor subunit [Veillonella caviae]MDY4745934.1 efflux RND transporter periplasmic adaptor subunit [Veillonella caviae]MDY5409597.1 efflux RND transporter periplasmic adaptor subunit [Veillonella caviae]MDY5480993.1 efflux RND transporter periplasmic adaptor subunit [Veillonella caviae]MDY6225179.1 efflux RND transporter periplasmic adaptor subunit [Veillonella caviae]
MKFRYSRMLAVLAVSALLVAGCGSQQQTAQDVAVNSYKVMSENTQLNNTYTGTVIAENSVAVHARVTGYVVEKYVKGGEQVVEGQPLYRIDSRQYESNVASAEANVAKADADLKNSEIDLNRYQILANQDAIARQRVDTQRSATEQARAVYEAQQAALKIAQDNLGDTIVYAPYSGTLRMDDVDLGTFVTAGSTTLVTIDSIDPIFVEFSMTEPEYLEFMANNAGDENSGTNLKLILANGEEYKGGVGAVVQAAKSLDNSTGKLVLKASFPNPDHLLLPNMYATVVSPGAPLTNALLIPTRSIQQIMDKNFVFVIGADGTVTQKAVELGGTSGAFTIIKSGLAEGDEIVVDGLTKVRNGVKVQAQPLTKSQLESAKQ